MTDKQIIIDGIDVSGCEHFLIHSCNDCSAYFLENEDSVVDCEKYPNCYYKQHKRDEQRIVELNKTIQAKEQECEELKEAIKTKTGKDYINEIQDITMKYECHQKSMGVCWWGKYGKETKCIGIKECHKRELEVIQKLETQLDQLKAENEELRKRLKFEFDETLLQYSNSLEELKEENEELKIYKSITPLSVKKLVKSLGEIKEIVQFGYRPYKFCGEYNDCCDVLNKIWNKISEVLE